MSQRELRSAGTSEKTARAKPTTGGKPTNGGKPNNGGKPTTGGTTNNGEKPVKKKTEIDEILQTLAVIKKK